MVTARGPADARVLGIAERLAGEAGEGGDELLTTTAQWFATGFSLESCATLREVALQHGERHPWALSVVVAAQTLALAGGFEAALGRPVTQRLPPHGRVKPADFGRPHRQPAQA